MISCVRVGTRPSVLALKQVEEIKQRLPSVAFDVIPIETKGDKDKSTPLTFHENSDFFSCEIERALLHGEIDVAIHSAKDLEECIPPELVIIAMTASISQFDCLLSHENWTLDMLPSGSRVGTSSKNRQEGILRFRNDLIVKDIRGNVDERLAQLDRGDFEAIVVAHAALIRLGLEKRISQILPSAFIKQHPLQGRLAVQAHRDRYDMKEIFGVINET